MSNPRWPWILDPPDNVCVTNLRLSLSPLNVNDSRINRVQLNSTVVLISKTRFSQSLVSNCLSSTPIPKPTSEVRVIGNLNAIFCLFILCASILILSLFCLFVSVFETGSYFVAQTVLEFLMLTLEHRDSPSCLPNAGSNCMHHHTQLNSFFPHLFTCLFTYLLFNVCVPTLCAQSVQVEVFLWKFSPPAMWILGNHTQVMRQVLLAKTFTYWVILPAQHTTLTLVSSFSVFLETDLISQANLNSLCGLWSSWFFCLS